MNATLDTRLGMAEAKIQTVMLELDEAFQGSGWQIDCVNVDTRNFANMKTEILVSKKGWEYAQQDVRVAPY